MKKLVSIFAFIIALSIGAMSPIDKPNIYEKFYPKYSQKEINSLAGKRVIYQYNNYNFVRFRNYGILQSYKMVKYPFEIKNTPVEFLQNGETGIFVSVQEVLSSKNSVWQNVLRDCPLLIKWDEKNSDGKEMFSCSSRFIDRISLKIGR